jgi:hypothetical protein
MYDQEKMALILLLLIEVLRLINKLIVTKTNGTKNIINLLPITLYPIDTPKTDDDETKINTKDEIKKDK